MPSPSLCFTFKLTLKFYCQFFSPQGDVGAAPQTEVEELIAVPWAHGRWGEPAQGTGMAPLPTMSSGPLLPGHIAKALLTMWEIPGPFISCWPHAALGAHGTSRGSWPRGVEVRCPWCCYQIPTSESGKIATPSSWDRAR